MATVRLTASPSPAVRRPPWYTHGFNRSVFYRMGARTGTFLPRPLRLRLATTIGRLASERLHAERALVSGNLARVIPEAPAERRAALVRDVFQNFAICFADLITANRSAETARRLLAGTDGAAHVDSALDSGRGVIVITAHLGNWELGGRILALRSARPTHVVVAAERDPEVARFLRGGAPPVRFVTLTDPTSSLPLVSALRRNEIVAVQGDRALGTRGDVRVPLFGVDASFPLGPFVLARAAGTPIVPAFCLLGADRRYTITVSPPIRVRRDGERGALECWVRLLERAVRRSPEQWFNFFDVWSSGPSR